jgi:hypothetical protein
MNALRLRCLIEPCAMLIRRVARFVLIELPVLMLSSVLPFLIAAGAVWLAAAPRDSMSRAALAVLLFGCYGAAGLAWGLRRAVCHSIGAAADLVQQHAPRVVNHVVSTLVDRVSAADRRIEIGVLRQNWSSATGHLAACSGLPARALGSLSRKLLRARTQVVEQFLAGLEQRGETHVSMESVAGYVQDRLIRLALEDARRRLALANLCGHSLSILLVSIPLAAVWCWGGTA